MGSAKHVWTREEEEGGGYLGRPVSRPSSHRAKRRALPSPFSPQSTRQIDPTDVTGTEDREDRMIGGEEGGGGDDGCVQWVGVSTRRSGERDSGEMETAVERDGGTAVGWWDGEHERHQRRGRAK